MKKLVIISVLLQEQFPVIKKARTSEPGDRNEFVPKTPSQELMRPPPLPAIETPDAATTVIIVCQMLT